LGNPTRAQGHIAQSQGEPPGSSPLRSDGSQDDPAGEAGPSYRKPRVSKLAQRRLSGSSPLRSEGLCDSQAGGWSVTAEANSRATFTEDAQMRVGKQL
jgi:hypothetical protein